MSSIFLERLRYLSFKRLFTHFAFCVWRLSIKYHHLWWNVVYRAFCCFFRWQLRKTKWKWKSLSLSNSLRPQGLYSPWNSPDQDTGVGSCSLLQGIFPTQGSNPGFPHCRWILYQLSHGGSHWGRQGDSKSCILSTCKHFPFISLPMQGLLPSFCPSELSS